ncbi:translocation/assembly module TamB domain-containing protein [Geobacter sp. AOG2]|uniref:translocation/assembly module TamB domain-containing protein n=1 Tax=Geobacter sp. AOG2 TaxID=1566347 RepID=UPI001CC37F8F|nr:translocation/assembly module TamB domain-containing protein [Geobacter sp. AOG2]GFE60360.1 hypothetical protein AOG2_09480 [Geobacter sp. AOG2]
MKRSTIHMLLLAVGATAVFITATAVVWLCGTTSGARWLLASVSLHTPLKITARVVEGRLLDHLRLTEVHAVMLQQEAELDSLDLRWQPLLLLGGRIAVQRLTLEGTSIRDNTPAGRQPPQISWPRLSGKAQFFDVTITHLRVDRFSYRRQGERPVIIDTAAASIEWQDGLLSLDDLEIASPDGRVTGNTVAGFRRPSLKTDLVVGLPHPLADMNVFSIHTRLLPGSGAEQLAGSLVLSGARGKRQQLQISGVAGVTRNGFNLRRLRLDRQESGGRVTGDGTLTITERGPFLKLRIALSGLNLAPELKTATNLTGELWFEGGAANYQGRFDLANQGTVRRTSHVSGRYSGNSHGVRFTSLHGTLLGGNAAGDLEVTWEEGLALRGVIRARGLNPAMIAPGWTGVVNVDISGALAYLAHAPLRWNMNAKLLDSDLHGQPLTGNLRAASNGGDLSVEALALHGKGFDIEAMGTLYTGLAFTTQVSDLSLLIPGTAGAFRADGRIRWRNGRPAGYLNGYGRALQVNGVKVANANITARLRNGGGYPIHATAALRAVHYKRFQADSLTVAADGTLHDHTLDATVQSSGADVRVGLSGSYDQVSWKGMITRLSGKDTVGAWHLLAPAALAVAAERLSIAPLAISGAGPERITITADLIQPLQGNVRVQWSGVNLARANQWLQGVRVDGTTSGSIQLGFAPKNKLTLAASADTQGLFTRDNHAFNVKRGLFTIDADEHGLHAGLELRLADHGLLKGAFSSRSPIRLAAPDTGNLTLEWSEVNLTLVQPWMPAGFNLEGRVTGHAAGKILMGSHLTLAGSAALSQTAVHLRTKGGDYNSTVRNAAIKWTWQGENLTGSTSLEMAEYGQIQGVFELPLPARFPTAIQQQGLVRATFKGRFREQGLLTSLFPGLIRESRGEVSGQLEITGTLREPRIGGDLHLARAGAYFPAAGVHVNEVRLDAHMENDLIRIGNFRADSGPGHISGTAVIRLKGWRVADYTGNLNGERFQAIYLPEIRMLVEPHLSFAGTSNTLAVRGDIRVPELLVQGPPRSSVVTRSKDVIIEGTPPQATHHFPLALDIQVRVIPGDHVKVKLEGVDAQLGGSINLKVRGPDQITSDGEIRLVKGRYKAYGIDLEIVRGRVYYTGDSIGQPTLDILALRTVGDVRAGVTVTGSLQTPTVKLYSEPAMTDTDTLAYIVLGHPLGSGSDQATLVIQAASQLLSSSQTYSLKDQIKNRLGLSTLEVGDKASTSAIMGYKVIAAAPPGTTTPQTTTGLSQTVATAGKYLTPQLYLSYGRSLFTGDNLIRLRYDISRRWNIETQTGTESGADIYYKIDFN